MRNKKLAIIIGCLIGLYLIPPFINLGVKVTFPMTLLLMGTCTLLLITGFKILESLGKKWKIIYELGKFAIAGSLNALLYLAILNLLIMSTYITKGPTFTLFVASAFLMSVVSSYYWNKYWTFENKNKITPKEYLRFIAFSSLSGLINIGLTSLLVNTIGAPAGINGKVWANIATSIGIITAFTFNFTSYKFIVFKNNSDL